MASHLKGVKKSTMVDDMRKALCEYIKTNPGITQKQLQQWVLEKFYLQVSQGTISNMIKRSSEYLSTALERGDVKRHKSAKFPDLEKVLYEWILQYQERVNITGKLIMEKAKEFLKKMYPQDTPEFHFSQGWLERFKSRHGIKNYHRFGESGSVDMEGMENKLKSIREKVVRLISSLDGEGIGELQNLIKGLNYRNGMDAEYLLNYSEEDNTTSEMLTDEEMIENIMGNEQSDEVEDESNAMESPSRKEALKAAKTLNNFLLHHEKTTPKIITMLRKVRDEIQGDINFKKQQVIIDSFFMKSS